MKKQNFIIPVTLGFFLLTMSLVLCDATLTVTAPTASQNVNGTFVFNVTTALANAVNCTWSTTSNANFAVTRNSSAGQTVFINSTATTGLTDASATTLSVICRNLTNSNETATVSFTIDNTNPVCSFTIDESMLNFMDTIGTKATSSSTDLTTLTYAWTLYDPNKASQKTATTSSYTFSGGDFDEIGTFTLGLTVTDAVGHKTSCTNKTIEVSGSSNSDDVDTAGGSTTTTTTTTGGQGFNPIFIVIVIVMIIVVIACVGFLLINYSKKRR